MRIDQIFKAFHVSGKFYTIILARPCLELRFGEIRARRVLVGLG